MYRLIYLVVSVSISAVGVTTYLSENEDEVLTAATIARDEIQMLQPKVTAAKEQQSQTRLSGVERIKRSANGHYQTDFKLNNKTVHGLIDTGASSIAMNKTTARQAGIRLTDKDFVYEVTTANGKAKAARAVIKRVTLGSIRVQDVEAVVLEDKALNTVLIGMSFLNRLRGFEYKSGNLVLRR